MRKLYFASALTVTSLLCPMAAMAQKATINAFILAEDECKKAYEKVAKKGETFTGKRIEHAVFQALLKRHSISVMASLDTPPREVLKNKLVSPCNSLSAAACKRKQTYPLEVRFAEDANSLRVRQSLLRLFRDLRSNKKSSDWVIGQVSGTGASLGPIQDSDYEGENDVAWLNAFLDHVGIKGNESKLPIILKCQTPPKPNFLAEAGSEFIRAVDRAIISDEVSDDSDWRFAIVKDASQFVEKTPAGAELGTQIAGTGDNRELKTDIAIGFVLDLNDKSVANNPWSADCLGSKWRSCNSGSKRSAATYLSYTQAPAKETVFDPSGATLADGSLLTKEQEFASGRLALGFRFDYEFFRGFIPPSPDQDGYNEEMLGRRRPEHKASFTLETFTDNFSDLQGNRAELAYKPPSHWLLDAPGYRRKSYLLDERFNTTFKWDADIVGDFVTYGRQPRNRDVTVEGDRLNLEEFARLGYNFELAFAGRRPFTRTSDPAWWEIKYNHVKRESFDGEAADAATDEVTVTLKDILRENWNLGVTYHNGRDPIDLQDQEYWAITVSAKR